MNNEKRKTINFVLTLNILYCISLRKSGLNFWRFLSVFGVKSYANAHT